MTINSRWPWSFRIALPAVFLTLGVATALWAYDEGRNLAGYGPTIDREQVAALERQLAELVYERDRLSSIANAAESQINIERATQNQLAQQVKALMDENTRLKEDLAFFEKLLPANAGQGVAIRRLKTEMISPNQIHYRLLIMNGGKGDSDFVGDLQLAVTVVPEGGSANAIMVFPQKNTPDTNRFKLNFKHYQRVEGVLTLPEGTKAMAVQARVLEKGQIRTQQTVNL